MKILMIILFVSEANVSNAEDHD